MTKDLDYGFLANTKTATQKKEEMKISIINADIAAIDDAINSNNEDNMKDVHITIEGKYSSYINNFGQSMYGYSKDFGFDYNYMGIESLKHNLRLMKANLQGYLCDFPIKAVCGIPQNNINLNVPVTNEININITFEQAKQQIEDMPGLTDSETDEIKSKIDDLENISKEPISKKKKWEKVKPILSFALDKGADVAIAIMSLILQMKLGM